MTISNNSNTCMTSSWMQRNMFTINRERRLTEAEMRVKKSIQKLSIPEWYLNSNSAPPKFLKNHSPFDLRSPSWKITATKKSLKTNPVLETKSPLDNHKRTCDNETKKNDSNDKAVTSPPRNSVKRRPSQKKNFKLTTSSYKTFPRMSPSRKIENINIVLPQKPLPKKLTKSDEISQQVEEINQFVERTIQEYDKIETSGNSTLFTSALGTPSGKSNNFKSARSDTFKVPKSPQFETPCSKVSKTSYLPIVSRSSMENTPKKTTALNSSVSKNLWSKNTSRSSASFSSLDSDMNSETSLFTSSKKSTELQKILKKNKIPRMNKSLVETIMQQLNQSSKKVVKSTYVSPGSRDHVKRLVRSFETGQILRPEEEEKDKSAEKSTKRKERVKYDSMSDTKSMSSSFEVVDKMVKKSKRREKRVENNSIADKKSMSSSFELVNKLVEKNKGREERVKNNSIAGMKSVSSSFEVVDKLVKKSKGREKRMENNNSIASMKSVSSLSSICSKDLEGPCGSEFERQLSPILRNAPLRASSPQEKKKKSVNEQENKVYWIPLPRNDLLRSNSLLSIMSRMSLDSSRQSLCGSPIERSTYSPEQFNDVIYQSDYARKDVAKRLFQHNEKIIVDSGYSDRSRSQSACSSTSDNSCYDDTENTRTTSEVDSDYELLYRASRFAQMHVAKKRA